MGNLLTLALLLALAGCLLLLLTSWLRRRRGLSSGTTVALDNVQLFSERLKLVGRPDRIVRIGELLIPEEWKSSRRVSHGHKLQIATYFLLIEDVHGIRPPHGVIVLGDGKRVEVENSEALRSEVLAIAERIREHRRRLSESIPVRQPATKCRGCGQLANCGQASR